MDAVLRATAIYLFLLLLFRISGRRSLGQLTSFDFVLLLVIGEVTQQALLGEDYSLTNAFLLIVTLLGIDVALSFAKREKRVLDTLLEGVPMVIAENGRLLHDRMHKARVDEEDVMQAARQMQGLERLDQIKYAVLEMNGAITIIPR